MKDGGGRENSSKEIPAHKVEVNFKKCTSGLQGKETSACCFMGITGAEK